MNACILINIDISVESLNNSVNETCPDNIAPSSGVVHHRPPNTQHNDSIDEMIMHQQRVKVLDSSSDEEEDAILSTNSINSTNSAYSTNSTAIMSNIGRGIDNNRHYDSKGSTSKTMVDRYSTHSTPTEADQADRGNQTNRAENNTAADASYDEVMNPYIMNPVSFDPSLMTK